MLTSDGRQPYTTLHYRKVNAFKFLNRFTQKVQKVIVCAAKPAICCTCHEARDKSKLFCSLRMGEEFVHTAGQDGPSQELLKPQ